MEYSLKMDRARVLIQMSGLNEILDYLAMANTVHWYGLGLTVDCHVLRKVLEIEIVDERRNWKLKK